MKGRSKSESNPDGKPLKFSGRRSLKKAPEGLQKSPTKTPEITVIDGDPKARGPRPNIAKLNLSNKTKMEVPEELAKIQKKSPRTVTVNEAQLMISPRMVSSQLAAKAREEDWDQLSDTPGVTMSDFTVGHLLGKGQFAEVFRCVHKATGKMFAIKTIRKTSYDSPDCEQRIHHTLVERRILSSLDHPYICRMSYAFQDSYHVYFALEVIEGGDLMKQYVNGPLPIERVRFYSAELVCIIKYLHSRNVIYRDLKPENIMMDVDGHVKLTDFGLSKIVKASDKTHTLAGTPHFLAPEMLLNARTTGYDHMVDWWSLGIVMHEMASKTLPFDGGTFQQLTDKIVNDKPVWPVYFDADLCSLLAGLLRKDPTKRFGNNIEEEVLKHPFFKGVDWSALEKRQVPAPPLTGKEAPRVSGPDLFKDFGESPVFTPPIRKKKVAGDGPPPPVPKKNDDDGAPPVPKKNNDDDGAPPVPKKNNDDDGAPPVPRKNDDDGAPPVPKKNDDSPAPPVPKKNEEQTPPDSEEDEVDDSA